jgi:putative ATP-dependent endonuclease of OLD family
MPDCAPAICINENYTSIQSYPQRRNWKTESELASEEEKKIYLDTIKEKADGQTVKTFVSNYWTFEYDLAYSGLLDDMLDALVKVRYEPKNQTQKLQEIKNKISSYNSPEEKAAYFYSYFYDGSTSKAEFAQCLAAILEKVYSNRSDELKQKLPGYIIDAIKYITE